MKIKTHNIKTFCLQVGQPLKERPEADIMTWLFSESNFTLTYESFVHNSRDELSKEPVLKWELSYTKKKN